MELGRTLNLAWLTPKCGLLALCGLETLATDSKDHSLALSKEGGL
jgi:hypothetical protein